MAYRPYIWRKNNPEKTTEQRRRSKVRTGLRKKGILPPVGVEMNEEQLLIDKQISNNDFTYWDTIKTRKGGDGGTQTKTSLKSPEYLLWYRVKWKCKENGMVFNISVEDIVIPEICEITNQPISTNLSDNRKDNYYTLSLIDYSKGYVPGNIKVVSILGLQTIFTENKIYLNVYDYTPEDKEKSIINRARENARRKGCEFNLQKSDIIIPTHCPYLGIELTYNKKDGKQDNYFSIDRIDSSKGYIKGNVQIISKLANTMKNNATIDQLIDFCKGVIRLHGDDLFNSLLDDLEYTPPQTNMKLILTEEQYNLIKSYSISV
jgi:hypothetical protein